MRIKNLIIQNLTDINFNCKDISYQIINHVLDYNGNAQAIIVNSLSSDYYLLFSKIKLIICENGSQLSHLAIVGRENTMPIYLASNVIGNIPQAGKLTLDDQVLYV